VTSGSNGSCGAPICNAGTGWDGPTGLGTPNGTAGFRGGGANPPPGNGGGATTPAPPGGGGATSGNWRANHAYNAGDTMTYNGHTYRCLQARTSLPEWEPPNVPALWQPVS
jgi:hypothetical protein